MLSYSYDTPDCLSGSCGTGLFRNLRGVFRTEYTWVETAAAKPNPVSFTFPLKPQFQSGIAAVLFCIFRHDGNRLFPAHDDQQLPGPGDGGVEDAAA